MICVDPSRAERRRGTFAIANRKRVLGAMQRDGVVVLDQIIEHTPLDALKVSMDRDSVELLAFCDSVGGNPRDRGHLPQGSPPIVPFVFAEYVVNPLICEALHAILGDGAYCEFYNGNTNCPGSTHQQLHLDGACAFLPRCSGADIGRGRERGAPGCGRTQRRGELWPGTHMIVVPTPVPGDAIAARRATVSPVRGVIRKGDVLLRDARLLHRGVPNPSAGYRHMIAMVVVNADKPRGGPIVFSRNCEALLASAPIQYHATFTDEPIDYLLGPTKRMLKALQGPNAARVTRH